jgi:hypothetical protein
MSSLFDVGQVSYPTKAIGPRSFEYEPAHPERA